MNNFDRDKNRILTICFAFMGLWISTSIIAIVVGDLNGINANTIMGWCDLFGGVCIFFISVLNTMFDISYYWNSNSPMFGNGNCKINEAKIIVDRITKLNNALDIGLSEPCNGSKK